MKFDLSNILSQSINSGEDFQAAICKKSLKADPETPSPIRNGWKYKGGNLMIDCMNGSPAPQAVMDLLLS